MADQAAEGQEKAPQPAKSKVLMVVVSAVLIAALVAGGGVMLLKQGPEVVAEKAAAEYLVGEKMYQLQDGSYLKLAFSIDRSKSVRVGVNH